MQESFEIFKIRIKLWKNDEVSKKFELEQFGSGNNYHHNRIVEEETLKHVQDELICCLSMEEL